MRVIHLKNGSINCDIDLQRGARLTSLRQGLREVIEPVELQNGLREKHDPSLGLLAMIPCVHHSSLRELKWTGTGHPHMSTMAADPMHDWGVGWQSSWQILEQSEDFALLSLEHRAEKNWPWSFDASQTIHLKPSALSMSLSLTNQSSVSSPGGLGWAFSLPVDKHDRFSIQANRLIDTHQQGAPGQLSVGVKENNIDRALDLELSMDQLKVGQCMDMRDGTFCVEGAHHRLQFESKLKTVQVKLSEDESSLVVKVMDLPMQVLEHTSAPPMLAPGESVSVQMSWMLLSVSQA